jgi:hypothetical protein
MLICAFSEEKKKKEKKKERKKERKNEKRKGVFGNQWNSKKLE